jgi:hypothetical protein
MKKILLFIFISLAFCIGAVYIFIPRKMGVSGALSFRANGDGLLRSLAEESNWKNWWPGIVTKTSNNSLRFTHDDYDFQVRELLYSAIKLKLIHSGDSSDALLRIIRFNNDSIRVELLSQVEAQRNPFSRVATYLRGKRIERTFNDIVLSLSTYAGKLKNIYGMDIKNERVEFQNLVSAKESFSHFPTTEDVYAIITRLRTYIKQAGAKELFSPMLNIKKTDSTNYTAQVGLPVDRALSDKDDISSKWMMKGGNILTGEVTGGQKEIEEAQKQMELYIIDYQRSIIAIPFQMLITDRTKEPDSAKWITRIYYPVV